MCSKNRRKVYKKTSAMAFFFSEIVGQDCNFTKKRIPSQVFSCEFCNSVEHSDRLLLVFISSLFEVEQIIISAFQ